MNTPSDVHPPIENPVLVLYWALNQYPVFLFIQIGLRSADQILEYNGIDLRQATAEQAAYELAKPAEKVSILVQYNPESKGINIFGNKLVALNAAD